MYKVQAGRGCEIRQKYFKALGLVPEQEQWTLAGVQQQNGAKHIPSASYQTEKGRKFCIR